MTVVQLNQCAVDLARHRVFRPDGRQERLTTREAAVLTYLVTRPGQTVALATLLKEIWGRRARSATRAVHTVVRRLRLKVESNPAKPEHLITITGLGFRFEPPDRPVSSAPVDEEDAFFGRVSYLSTIEALHDEGRRLVTISGPPGMGKSRLAREYSRKRDFESVHLCDLAAVRTLPDLLVGVAAGLGVGPRAGLHLDGVVHQLGAALRDRGRCLLVLDNFEGAARWAEQTVVEWMNAAAEAVFLVTSREPLGAAAEYVVPLQSLQPEAAVALFESRAAGSAADWRCPPDCEAKLGALVARLDGLPLAIELVAAQVGELTLIGVLDGLDRRFQLLQITASKSSRHRTLEGTLDVSWGLLTPHERSALVQLSVFRGGFTVEAAEAVVALSPDAPPILDVVASLLDKSLLRAQPSGGPRRLGHYDFIAAYACARLALEQDNRVRQCALRHARFFGQYGVGEEESPPEERANIADALQWCIGAELLEDAVDCLLALTRIVRLVGSARELEAPRDALLACNLSDGLRLKVLMSCSNLLREKPFLSRSVAAVEEGLHLARRLGEQTMVCEALFAMAFIHERKGDMPRREECFQEAVELAVGMDQPRQTMMAYRGLAYWHLDLHDPETANLWARRSLEIYLSLGSDRQIGAAHGTLAIVLQRQGMWEPAREQYQLGISRVRACGSQISEKFMLEGLANLAREQGDLLAALELHAQAADIAAFAGLPRGVQLGNLALLQRAMGDLAQAKDTFEESIAQMEHEKDPQKLTYNLGNYGALLVEMGDYHGARIHLDDCLGRLHTADRAHIGAFTAVLGLLKALEGEVDSGRRLASKARSHLEAAVYPSELCKAIATQGEIEVLGGDLVAAASYLGEATMLVDELNSAKHSDARVAVMKLHRALSSRRA